MPNRIIKESIITSETLAELTGDEERLFWRLIVLADDFGRFHGDQLLLRPMCFPRLIDRVSQSEFDTWFARLCSPEIDLIRPYEVDGKRYVQITTWDKHQQRRAKKSKFPAPPTNASANQQPLAHVDTCTQMISDDSTCNQMPANVPVFENVFENENDHAGGRETSSSSSDGQALSLQPEPEVIPEREWERLAGRVVTSTQSQEIQQFLADGMEPEVIVWAIETAVAEGKRNWSYARGIIRNLFSEGDTPCLTMAQVQEREATRQERSRADPPPEPDTPPEVTDAELRRLEWMVQMRRQEVAGDGNSNGNGTTDDAPVARRL